MEDTTTHAWASTAETKVANKKDEAATKGRKAEQTEMGRRIERCAEIVGGKKALSELTGIAQTTLYRFIGTPTQPKPSQLQKIAEAAGVPIAWLASGSQPVSDDAATLAEEIESLPPGPRAILRQLAHEFRGMVLQGGSATIDDSGRWKVAQRTDNSAPREKKK